MDAVARSFARLTAPSALVILLLFCTAAGSPAADDAAGSTSVAREVPIDNGGGNADSVQAPPTSREVPSAAFTVEPVNIKAVLDPPADESHLRPEDYTVPTDINKLIEFLARDYQPLETDLTLDEAIQLALTHNHAMNSARLNAMAACEGISINWAALRPQLNLTTKAYYTDSNLNAPTFDTGQGSGSIDFTGASAPDLKSQAVFSLTQRIYDFGMTNDLIDVAEAQHSIQNYSVDMAEQQLVDNVVNAYYNFNVALAQVRIRMDELDLSHEFLRQAQIQYDVGVVPRLDVIRAEARVQQANSDLVAANARAGDAAAYFFSLLGMEDQRYIPAIVTADLLKVGEPEPELADAVDTALENRPEIEMQYSTLFAGEKQKSLARNRPILNAYANAVYMGYKGSSFQPTDTYEYGLQLVWPLYTGGKDVHTAKQAQYKTMALAEGIFDLEAKIELDVTQAWNRVQAAIGVSEAARKNLDLTGEALRAASVGYNAGVTPYIEFQDALDKNIAAALNYAVSLGEVKMAQANLVRAQGFPQGYPGDPRAASDDDVSAAALLGLEKVRDQQAEQEPVSQ